MTANTDAMDEFEAREADKELDRLIGRQLERKDAEISRLRELLRSYAGLAPDMFQWKPIETARKLPIGTEILAYRPLAPRSGDDKITVVATTSHATVSPQGVKHFTDRWCHPTHWMPLPPAPDAPKDEQEQQS